MTHASGLGRFSGLVHLAILYPKISACLVALGLAGVYAADSLYSGASLAEEREVAEYCRNPNPVALAAFPAELRSRIDEVCACALDDLQCHHNK